MSDKTKLETKVVTADGVIKAVSNGAKSLTGIAKMLGYKSGSSAILKKIIQAVPDIESRIASNKPAKDADGKTKGKKTISEKLQAPSAQEEAEWLCPFRKGSKYAAVWLALWHHRKTGVTRKALIEEVTSADKRFSNPATCNFSVTVVASPTKDGRSHRSANKAGDLYWVQKWDGGNLQLHLRSESK